MAKGQRKKEPEGKKMKNPPAKGRAPAKKLRLDKVAEICQRSIGEELK